MTRCNSSYPHAMDEVKCNRQAEGEVKAAVGYLIRKRVLLFALLPMFFILLQLQPLAISYAVAADDAGMSSIGSVTGLTIPRFVTLKSRDINIRSGPGPKYPLRLNYKCKGYPVQVVAEFENWRLIKDHQGNEGWAHESLLASMSNVIVVNNAIENEQIIKDETLLFRMPNDKSHPIARVEFGAIVHIKRCIDNWCNVSLGRAHDGWIKRSSVWGVPE